MIPMARRVLGENDRITLTMRVLYARAIYCDDSATVVPRTVNGTRHIGVDDLREAVTTFEDTERTARRVLGNAHPFTSGIVISLRYSRAALRARETPSPGSA
jgi:hypothetical protein